MAAEWCLAGTHLCVSAEAWAGWAQAVGTVFAILGTAWAVQRSHRLQIAADRVREARQAAAIECEPKPDGPINDEEMAAFFRGRAEFQSEFAALAAARGYRVQVIEAGTGPAVKVATTQ